MSNPAQGLSATQTAHMQPTIPVPTDNIYKFACLFGLALIVSAVFAFVTSYSTSLDRKIRYSEIIIPLEAMEKRTPVEQNLLDLNKKLIQITKSNEDFAGSVIGAVATLGLILSAFGAKRWYQVIQTRDDKLAEFQLRKVAAEVAALESKARAVVWR